MKRDRHGMRTLNRNRFFPFSFFFCSWKRERPTARELKEPRWISYVHKARRCTYVRRCCEIDGAWDERVSSLQKNPRAPFARNLASLQGVSATNYACVGYALFTHRECESAQHGVYDSLWGIWAYLQHKRDTILSKLLN